MKFCHKCGNRLEDNAKFCDKCGTRASMPVTPVPIAPSPTPPQQQQLKPVAPVQPANEQPAQPAEPVQLAYDRPAQQPVIQQPAMQKPVPQPPKKKRPTGLILGIAAAVVALVIVIGIFSGTDSSGNQGGNIGSNQGGSLNNGIVTLPDLPDNTPPSGVAEKTKTVMIYIVGSDLESRYGSASVDILEMTESGVDTTRNNILIYTGGTKQWALSGIPVDKNCIYQLKNGEFELVKEYSPSNMGSSNTLSEFISFSLANYAADEYGLILWDHGGGPMLGYGWDEKHNDMLELSELKNALASSGLGSNKKLEFLGFDACLMGSIEIGWIVKDYANYMIASQETEPGFGWDYRFLKYLNNYDSGRDIGKVIVDTYFAAYEQIVAQQPQEEAELTLSCVDLTKIEKVESSLNNLFDKVDANILSGYFSRASQYRHKAKCFGKYTTGEEYDLVDISHMASLLSADYSAEAAQLNADLQEFVCYSKANVKNASGISIYHPYDNPMYMKPWIEQFRDLGFASEYADYISSFSTILSNPSSSSWKSFSSMKGSAVKNGTDNELSIQLTQEQVENYAGSAYYILKRMKENEYMFIFAGFDTHLSADGTLSASYDNKAVFAVSDKTKKPSDAPITMYQVRDGSGEQKYNASAIFWLFADDITQWRVDPVEWQIKIEDGKPKALSAYLIETENGKLLPQKQLLDYTQYSTIEFSFTTRTPKKDADGNLLPYFQWDSTGWAYGNDYKVLDGFHFECREIDNNEDYVVMFVVNDVQGRSYASDLFTLPKEK